VDGTAPLRILGATAYPLTVASARVRIASYVPLLRAHGIELDYRPTLTDHEYALLGSGASAVRKAAVLANSARRAALTRDHHDLVLVHRLHLLTPLPMVDPPRHLDVYDIDDALFLGSTAEVNRGFRWAKQEARRAVDCMRRARMVVAGNDFLAARAREYAEHVEVIPTCVDPTRQPLHEHRPAEVATIGWIGSRTTSVYLQAVLPALAELNRPRVRAKLVLVGADPGLRADWVEHHDWSLASETDLLARFDIGIMPLPDSDWARGKCGYKLLQYFSAGVPAVASPVGVNADLIGRDRGLLASSPEEWRSALDALISDPGRRRESGQAARAYVERDYSYERWAPELAGILKGARG
jgi:glycosyltransferase involved in cell wall biosynthesis